MPTVSEQIDVVGVVKACGYQYSASVDCFENLDVELQSTQKRNVLSLIEEKCCIGSRENLGRPTIIHM